MNKHVSINKSGNCEVGLDKRGLWDINGWLMAATPEQLRALADKLEKLQK